MANQMHSEVIPPLEMEQVLMHIHESCLPAKPHAAKNKAEKKKAAALAAQRQEKGGKNEQKSPNPKGST
jgi:hypothetical protein